MSQGMMPGPGVKAYAAPANFYTNLNTASLVHGSALPQSDYTHSGFYIEATSPTGTTLTFTAANLPAGVTATMYQQGSNDLYFYINGTPTTVGAFSATFTATYPGGQTAVYTWAGTVAAAAMTLTGTLTGTVNTGASYSSTLTLGGDFVAPVSIDAASGTIPTWLTASVSGTTVTFSGAAPASAETDSFTPRATDGNNQVAVGSAQSIQVQAASSQPTLVQSAAATIAYGATSGSATLPVPATNGNLLIAYVQSLANDQAVDNGFSLEPGGAVTTCGLFIWDKIAAGGEQTITLSSSSTSTRMALYVQEWSHAAIGSVASVSALTTNQTLSVDTGAPPSGGAVAIVAASLGYSGAFSSRFQPDSPWTADGTTASGGSYEVGAMWRSITTQTTLTGTITVSGWHRFCPIWLIGA